MLQHYYATENPLPTGAALYRLLRAHIKSERDAIDTVVKTFWSETDEGLVNGRAIEELQRAEGQRQHNQVAGKLGGRPRKKTHVVSETKPGNNPSGLDLETKVVMKTKPGNNPIQTPDSRQTTPSRAKALSGVPRARKAALKPLPADFAISERVQKWATEKGVNRLPEHLEAFKQKCRAKNYEYADWDEAFMGAIRENWARVTESQPAGSKKWFSNAI